GCHGLVKRYGRRLAVDGVDRRVGAGECYGVLGPNGAGKTTVISMVCGLARPDAGTVTIGGVTLRRSRPTPSPLIGYVPQEVALYDDLTATENLRFFGRLAGLRAAALDRRVGEVLALVGLTGRAGDRVSAYSGGMKRRLNIAVGLVHEPRLLVLDEPTVGVDPQSRNAILETVGGLARHGMSV